MDIALRNMVKKQLLWISLAAISMFFASMLSAFIVEKADVGNWKEFILPNYFVLVLGLLFSVVYCYFLLNHNLKKKSQYLVWCFLF
jgi:hypothetical protein